MRNYEAEKLKGIIKAKEGAMIAQVAETDELRKRLKRAEAELERVKSGFMVEGASDSEILPDLLNLEWTYSRDQNGNKIEFDWSDWKIEKQPKQKGD